MPRVRVEIQGAAGTRQAAASVWCDWTGEDGDRASLRLLHDYPELQPTKGWRVVKDGVAWTVTSADGRNLGLSRVAVETEGPVPEEPDEETE